MFALNLLRHQATRQINRRTSGYMQTRSKAKFKDGGEHATFNDMPIPQGSWQEYNARRQNRYMMVFLSGIASFVASVIFVAKSGKMELNYTVPDYPYEEEEE
ncbi:uncharacterized protein LOC111679772 [Lucilia cuprina]|uniref:uncharacterized protein LOC111679772 n=1 Tax=Lucilia cuprina TaxID=7375 RepID=UPI000C71A4FE|nr:uncharacterized protein LOC111679772 [Lucilia cuprina]